MVAPKHEEVFWVLDFVGSQKTECFDALSSSVDIVSQEQIVCRWRLTTETENA